MTQKHSHISKKLIGAIDAGSKTIRFALFSANREEEYLCHEVDIHTTSPQEGWVEQDPIKLLSAALICIDETIQKLKQLGGSVDEIAAVGITNQRETTVIWDSETGQPLYNAISWCDNRTNKIMDVLLSKFPDQNKDFLKHFCGLPVSAYFSALKIRWLLEHISAVKSAVKRNKCLFGTVDTWLIWNLTGGRNGGLHITDVTNASRTMLMNIKTLKWDLVLCKYLDIPMEILPAIRSSCEIYANIDCETPLRGIPISAILGNQQAALIGQRCLNVGQAKSTYRSGCFLLYNTGHRCIQSSHGLLTTVAYQLGPNEPPVYALEGSVAIAGAVLEWLRDNLKMVKTPNELASIATDESTAGDIYFVPAFSGLYAPYWRQDAMGIICGLTQFTKRIHVIRSALEAICFQTKDILEAMYHDCEFVLNNLQVDGEVAQNNPLLQLQADIIGIPVVRFNNAHVSSLGVAMAAGHAKGIDLWNLFELPSGSTSNHDVFLPCISNEDRCLRYKKWKMAVQKSLGWAKKGKVLLPDAKLKLLSSVPISIFVISSFGLLVLSQFVKNA